MSFVDWFFLGYFVALDTFYSVLILLGFAELSRRRRVRLPELDQAVLASPATPPIDLLAPAYNEAKSIVDSVRAFLALRYPNHRVIVVNDGSSDDTLAVLSAAFDLRPARRANTHALPCEPVRGIWVSRADPRLLVVDKEAGGKADALNAGLNIATSPLVCAVDADTLIAPDALLRMVEPFLFDPRSVVAVGGTVRVVNGCTVEDGRITRHGIPRRWLPRFQIVEYLRSFLFGRLGYNRLGGNLIISGAFGMFSHDAVVEAGGWAQTVGEDMELVVRLRRTFPERSVVHIPEPVCYTEVPAHWRQLARQRDRWQRGLTDSLWRHRAIFMRPKYGALGLVAYPSFVIFEWLGVWVELAGYAWFAWILVTDGVNAPFVILFLILAYVWGFAISAMSLLFDWWTTRRLRTRRERWRLLAAAALENFGYRQFILLQRAKGTIAHILGKRSWGEMKREGYESTRPTPAKKDSAEAP